MIIFGFIGKLHSRELNEIFLTSTTFIRSIERFLLHSPASDLSHEKVEKENQNLNAIEKRRMEKLNGIEHI